VFAKAALRLRGFGVGDPRLPQIPATHQQTEQIAKDLDEIGPLL
jgi:4-hydroxy-tetrahydrodipicolinate synthase